MRTRTMPIAAGLVATVAALMAGCSPTQTADCVDAYGHVVPDAVCASNYRDDGNGSVIIVHSGGPRYIYGGTITHYGGVGRVSGGSYTPSSSASIMTRSGSTVVSRGGFGGSASYHGGGGFGG